MDPVRGMENSVAPDRPAAWSPEGCPPLIGRARPAHRLHRPDGDLFEHIDGPRFAVQRGVKTASARLAASYPTETYAFFTSLKRTDQEAVGGSLDDFGNG